jgi:hypothetical protein
MIRHAFALVMMATPAFAQDTGLATWGKIHEVFSHRRCAYCHVGPDNAPLVSLSEHRLNPRPHGMNVNGGKSRKGVESVACNACHTKHNSPLPHGAPGAPVWWLPPVAMQWFGKSSAEICAQIKDREGKRNRSIAEIADFIVIEELIHWGWEPGPGREPAPYSWPQLVEFIKQWDAAGAPCPAQ